MQQTLGRCVLACELMSNLYIPWQGMAYWTRIRTPRLLNPLCYEACCHQRSTHAFKNFSCPRNNTDQVDSVAPVPVNAAAGIIAAGLSAVVVLTGVPLLEKVIVVVPNSGIPPSKLVRVHGRKLEGPVAVVLAFVQVQVPVGNGFSPEAISDVLKSQVAVVNVHDRSSSPNGQHATSTGADVRPLEVASCSHGVY